MEIPVEKHPLKPFLPANAKLLMLGSFPPPRHRWCMDFYYPNPQNDMWRIFGHVFFRGQDAFFERGQSHIQPRTCGRIRFANGCGTVRYRLCRAAPQGERGGSVFGSRREYRHRQAFEKNPGVPRHRDDGGEGERCAVRVERRREVNDADGEAFAFTTVKA